MRNLNINYKNLNFKILIFIFILFVSKSTYSNEIKYEIKGNDYTDPNVILSLLNDISKNADKDNSNEILKALNESGLFSDVRIDFVNNNYVITITEYPNINKLIFKNNDRLKDEDLKLIASEINFTNYNTQSLNLFLNEIKKVYSSFGYNNINIEYSKKIYKETNTIDLSFDISEGKLTKINSIIIQGNNSILAEEIKEIILTKTKSIRNIFANNNYKPAVVNRDKYTIINYYKDNGFIDANVETAIEYIKSNRVNIYFNIKEGKVYNLSSIKFSDENKILKSETLDLINAKIENFLINQEIFSLNKITGLKNEISSIVIESGNDFFEIQSFDKIAENKIDVLFKILPILPEYTNQINIIGNYRTFDYVIRRELEIVEGDAIHETHIQSIRNKLISLDLFESVELKKEEVGENLVNLIIDVEEKQTGSFNAGVSIGTLDGVAIVTGLRERNFYGTGRSLDFLVNTSKDKNQFKLVTRDRLSYTNDADISLSFNYKQEDFTKASSYKLDTLSSGLGLGYKVNKNTYHKIDLEYLLKDYKVTNTSTASSSILSSSGSNMSYLITNNLGYSTVNPGFISKRGNYINFNNTIETPTSSSNGFVRNILTLKKFYSYDDNILSVQSRFGNIFSLNNNDILTDNKFALGGKWLRGFDNYGAGPRNSRTSYVGGNNVAVAKIDYSYAITKNSNFPFYVNIFNDYGLIWENKTKPTKSDSNIRASAGFGIKYYSPIGPIGFTWGFPLIEEEYDIKRMFLFSIGNID
tara:strand:- start:2518 stop:4788 length:2271 start_codon:yes stop_codon:yes gene_type:complete